MLDEAEEEVSAIKRALGLDTSLDTNEMQGNVVEEQTPHVKMTEVVASAKEPVPVTEFPEKKVTPTVGGVKQDQKVMTKFDVAKEEKAAAGCCCCVM